MIDFGRLKGIREDNDISQTKMANILGVKRSTYSLWELAINIIPLNYLCKYADYFNYSIDYVLGLSNQKNSNDLIQGLDLKILGKNLKDIRIKNKLLQQEMANILNVTQACITRYENGLIQISTSNLYKVSKKFNIPLNNLCGKTKEKTKVKL